MLEMKKLMPERIRRIRLSLLAGILFALFLTQTVLAAEPIKISYYYEEVCASCDGTKDFFELYNRAISSEDKKLFQAEIATYNVFMDSCRVQYEDVKEKLEIPSGTSLPVLVIGNQWISGHENMEAQLRDVLMVEKDAVHDTETATGQVVAETVETIETAAEEEPSAFWAEAKAEIEASEKPVVLLFSTNGCDDCDAVKEWFAEHEASFDGQVLEYNIIEKECLQELKAVFTQYQVPEENQKVPAVFFGDHYLIGRDEISTIRNEMLKEDSDNETLIEMLDQAAGGQEGTAVESMNLWTLAAAGLLAGFNPCSISMLLMLLSLLLSEKASIWKSGLLYLAGKYAAYLSIGLVIFVTASQISNQTMETVGNVMQIVMGILFAVAAVFYIMDAIRIYRQDYGNIKTQLPVGLRRMNHNLIKKVSSAGGIMQPLMILVLGIVISFGEFFCTGQIYMASITYLLKDQVKAAVFPFLVYTTAMSIPAVIMILLIQRTRNTDAVSDFMFRHLGAIKIFNAILFILFALYFLVF
ncbi:MAG: sulfite exporter TauE/SafE family protein [Lachnospiraceae bacterium]|nr:sulfite exporter TauE/SafE family protein [Lachnospiraceae bacterium]